MSSRLFISPTFDLHLAPYRPCTFIRKSCGTHLTKLFAHVHCVSLDLGSFVNTYVAGASCMSAAVPLPPDDLVTVSSFPPEQISTHMLGSTACGKVDEMLYQGLEGLYVLRLPTRETPHELPSSPTTVTHYRKPSAAATRLIRSTTVITITENRRRCTYPKRST